MLWLAKFLFTISLGFHMRTAAIDTVAYDYMYEAKVRSIYAEAECQLERDTGQHFNMFHIRTKPFQGIYAEINIDEEHQVSRQYLYADLINLDILKLRTSHQWTAWKDARWLGGLEINFDTKRIDTRYEFDTNLKDRYVSRFKFEYKWLQDDIWYVMPYYKYERFNNDNSWKLGIEYGFDFIELLEVTGLERSEK